MLNSKLSTKDTTAAMIHMILSLDSGSELLADSGSTKPRRVPAGRKAIGDAHTCTGGGGSIDCRTGCGRSRADGKRIARPAGSSCQVYLVVPGDIRELRAAGSRYSEAQGSKVLESASRVDPGVLDNQRVVGLGS